MGRRTLLLLCASLAACASESPQELQARALDTKTWELCYIVVTDYGSKAVQSAAYSELQRRGSNCQAEMPMVMARLQADANNAAARAAAWRQIQSNPYYQQLMRGTPQQQVCNTRYMNGGWQTICN